MRSKFFYTLLFLMGILTATEAQERLVQQNQWENKPVQNNQENIDTESPIVPGDQLSFRIAEDGDPAQTLVVSDSGEVQVPYIGSVMAAGKTPQAVAATIKKALEANLYKKATVFVSLERRSERSPGRVFLSGEVKREGPIALRADEALTVSEAILEAGGFSDFANKRRVRLIRKGGGSKHVTEVDVGKILTKGRTDLDITLQPGDVITVPARFINW